MSSKIRKDMKGELRESLTALMHGSRSEYTDAKKRIERLWHADSKSFQQCAPVAFEYLSHFNAIAKVENQVAFASGLGLFYLALSDEYFSILKTFTIKTLQHRDGHVREAIRKSADWLYVSLTARAEPFVYPEGTELTEAQKTEQSKARQEYLSFVAELEELIDRYEEEDEDEHTEYIDDMKPSINKSLQLLWARLTDGRVFRRISESARPVPAEIFLKRKVIEEELVRLLKETNSDFGIEDIKEVIFHEEDNDDMQKLISLFDRGGDVSKLNSVIEVVSDAWNYFPHKVLGGLCPQEKLMEFKHSRRTS